MLSSRFVRFVPFAFLNMTRPWNKADMPKAATTPDAGINILFPSHANSSTNKDGTNEKDEMGPQMPGSADGVDVSNQKPRHRFLSRAEWVVLAHGVGAVSDSEQHQLVHPTHWWWPPKGMISGLYKSVVLERTKSLYLFHTASICRWTLMIAQLLIGAALTALGPQSMKDGTPITVLGAVNTTIAGLLALLHNSGLPDRFRHNQAEFEGLEDHIRELLDTGLVPADKTIDQVLAECFDIFQEAKATVQANMPVTYNPGQGLKGARQSCVIPQRSPSVQPVAANSRPRSTPGPEKTERGSSSGAGV
jgi:hypothetical protein